jgi:hypothetical protein
LLVLNCRQAMNIIDHYYSNMRFPTAVSEAQLLLNCLSEYKHPLRVGSTLLAII